MYKTIPVSARNIKILKKLGTIILPYGTTRIESSPTVKNDEPNFVVVIINNPQFTETQLWVKPFYSGYKTAWKKTFGVHSIPSGMDVDHIHARKRAGDLGYDYIRLALVPASANSSAGGGYEKLLFKAYKKVYGKAERREIPEIRCLDEVQAVKIRGTKIGSSKQGYPGFFQTHQNLIPPRTLGSKKDRHGQELPWILK